MDACACLTSFVGPVMLKVRPAGQRQIRGSMTKQDHWLQSCWLLERLRPRLLWLPCPCGGGELACATYSEFTSKDEYFFTNLLTEKRSCGMIGKAWT